MSRTTRQKRTGVRAINPHCDCPSCAATAKPSDRRRIDAARERTKRAIRDTQPVFATLTLDADGLRLSCANDAT